MNLGFRACLFLAPHSFALAVSIKRQKREVIDSSLSFAWHAETFNLIEGVETDSQSIFNKAPHHFLALMRSTELPFRFPGVPGVPSAFKECQPPLPVSETDN